MRGVALVVLLAAPAAAQELRPAPDYFVETAMETSTANILAVNCPRLSINLGVVAQRSAATLDRLTAEGFTPRILAEEMEDPTEAIAVLQDAFTARHGLTDGAPEADVCAAGLAEMEAETGIGTLLVEVGE